MHKILRAPPGGIWRDRLRVPGEGSLERAQRGSDGGGHLGERPPTTPPPLPAGTHGGSDDALARKKKKLSPWPRASVPAPLAAAAPRSSQGKQLLTSPCVLPARSLLPGGRGRGARPGGGAERAGRPAFLSPRSSSPPPLAPASSLRPQFGAWLGFSRAGKFLRSPQPPSLGLALGPPPAPAVPSPPAPSAPLSLSALSRTPSPRSPPAPGP